MKTTQISMFLAAGLCSLFAVSANAQITTPFPSGINLFKAPVLGNNEANYQAALGSYYFASDGDVPGEISAGLNGWTGAPLNLATALGGNPWLSGGGTVNAIDLGETAGWPDDIGYIGSTNPSVHNALATDIHGQADIFSGTETLVNYSAGTSLDFFVNSGGPFNQGGLFYAFGTANEFDGTDTTTHIRWKVADVLTTYIGADGLLTESLVKTLLVGFEDTRAGVSFYDGDFNDFVVGFQFLPPQLESVPEPSTYGLIGAAALIGIAGWRRFKSARASAAA
jgi:hypothetical protein